MRWERVAFDLYGTLLDVEGLAKKLEPLAGPAAPEILARWRKAQLERSWRAKVYEPWDVVTARALLEAAPQLDEATRAKMCATWLSLPAHPDARQALESLRKARMRTAVLSNGTLPMIRAALDAAGLEVDEVHSADEVRAYKTDPRVYALVPKETTLFVSGNGWDAEGAKRNGLSVAWIDRGTPAPGLAPDLRVTSLLEVAAAIWREHGVRVVKGGRARSEHGADAGHDRAPRPSPRRARAPRSCGQERWSSTPMPRPARTTTARSRRDLRGQRAGADALGRAARIHRRGGPRRFHLRAALRAAPGDQRQRDQELSCVLVRSGQEPVVVNLEIAPKEPPENVKWLDDLHRG